MGLRWGEERDKWLWMYFFLKVSDWSYMKEKVLLCKSMKMCVCTWEAVCTPPSIVAMHMHECSSLHSLYKHAKKTDDSIRRTRLSCSCQSETACRVSGGLKRAMLPVMFPDFQLRRRLSLLNMWHARTPKKECCVSPPPTTGEKPIAFVFEFYIRCWH